ncbi:hypothetical protein TTHERM_01436740 (macronuclear) [Tetrahymena thermophila SB210]|uniref:Uncharacterized protein n=1 Tax=Tetrahymena thermophila (strain SB210) TaxID=312017 RepID=Q229C6_TETTS|nr:hypothetical protein TTHERM_01436740 [Tetrahymena thermophila SB210]EAR81890.1 hypothetical protein TTHERM_01436740 [Tetrahymena thermophila SB210]|eukprot:XP_001029553.1 hypothetical protein TTHERM_01436740 [Tetrahymena thermophila SB210]
MNECFVVRGKRIKPNPEKFLNPPTQKEQQQHSQFVSKYRSRRCYMQLFSGVDFSKLFQKKIRADQFSLQILQSYIQYINSIFFRKNR